MAEGLDGIENIRAIAWDFDGVLNRAGIPAAGGKYRWQHAMTAAFGMDTADLAQRVFGGDMRAVLTGKDDILDRIDGWVQASGFEGDAEDILELWFTAEHDPDEDLIRLIAQLDQAGVTQVIATNNDPRRMRYIAVEADWAQTVDAIFASGEMGVMKPDVEYYTHIEAALGLQAPEILLIDDLERNIDAADKRGWLTWQYKSGGAMALAQGLMPLLLRGQE